ncbi:hypothetical protein ACFFJX_17830 [Pseudarcicella hirudinis]
MAQGCIAVRPMSSVIGNVNNPNQIMHPGQWQVSLGYRYLHSFRHYLGSEEQTQRIEQGTQVINDTHNFDLGVSYAVSSRLSLALNLPVSTNDRSSLYEHYGNSLTANPDQKRFHTYSKGIGDLRLTATYWLLDPMKHSKGNIAIGLGVKAPTGDFNVLDQFHRLDADKKDYTVLKAVDQSIQLGDGGWGGSIEVQGYRQVFTKTSLYFNGFYLFSPKVKNESTGFSVPDQFAARVGLAYALIPKHGFAVSLGGRIEGLPSIDAFGSSDGGRRPGYIISVEPGVTWSGIKNTFALTVPIALVRNRTPTWTSTGMKPGDAAFADYLISATVSHRF